MDIELMLIEAIKNRLMVNFIYDSNPIRRAAPHAIYFDKSGHKFLDAYQYGGFSKSGNLPEWRSFRLLKIQSLELLKETFKVAPKYNPEAKRYDRRIIKINSYI